MASATPASTEPHSVKRIKTVKISPTEPKASKPMVMVADTIYDAIVTVKVGEAETNFGIHRGLLRRASRFFREALASSETTEGGVVDQIVIMKEEDPDVFHRFIVWLYSEKVISELETYKNLNWEAIIAVYAFAERKGIPRLLNTCVDAVIKKRRDGGLFPGQADVNKLWEFTGNVFRLQRLILDLFATGCNLTNAIAGNGSYHPRFLQGLILILYEMKAKRTMYERVDYWQKRRKYYVDDSENPILLD